jgi:hypothetical protein
MILVTVGLVRLVLGLVSGGVLVAVASGLLAAAPGPMLWVAFPLLARVGYGLLTVGSRASGLRGASFGVSCAMLVLALASAVVLVLQGAAMMPSAGGSIALWCVMTIAGLLGAVGAASTSTCAAAD